MYIHIQQPPAVSTAISEAIAKLRLASERPVIVHQGYGHIRDADAPVPTPTPTV